MSRLTRALATTAAVVLAVPAWALPAHAETSMETASNGAYFYSAGIDKPEQSPAQPPNITGDRTDGVAPGHLGVAVRFPTQEDKRSFLFFDLLEVGFDGTISKAVVTVPLADGEGNMQMSPAPERVKACPADATGFAAEDGASFQQSPKPMCEVFEVKGAPSPDGKAYLFDVTTMAQSWVAEANNGMALVPSDLASPFQVVFKPFADATIDVEYTPGADALAEEEIFPETFAEDSFTSELPVDSGTSSFDTGSFDSGTASAAEDLGFGVADLPAIDSELPQTAAAEESVPEPALAADTVPAAAATAFRESLSPTTGLLVGAVLLAALLGGLSLIMGDPTAPASTATGRPSRLSQALQSRDRARGLMSRTPSS